MAPSIPLFSFIVAMFVTMLLIPPLMRWAGPFKLLDMPDLRKVHAQPVPRVGGIAMLAGTLLPMLMWQSVDALTTGMLGGMVVIFLFGLWDDRRDLDYRLKLAGQLIAVAVVMGQGGLLIHTLPFAGIGELPGYVAVPLTLLFLLGITNAINLADGLDGLAGGTTLLIFSAIALLAHGAGDHAVLLAALAVMGSILGFLRFNTHPARVFMGDSGSQVLGFTVGVLAVRLSQSTEASLSPALPVLLLGLPILDTLLVMGQRLYEGRSPFMADRNHIHHRLLALGFEQFEAVLLIYVTQASLVSGAYLLRHAADGLILGLYVLFSVAVVLILHVAERRAWRIRRQSGTRRPGRPWRGLDALLRHGHWARLPGLAAAVTVPVYLGLSAAMLERVPPDIGLLAGALLGVLVIGRQRYGGQALHWLEGAAIYVTATMLIYLVHSQPGPADRLESYVHVYFLLLALVVVLGFRFARQSSFKATPLDFLVIFIALTIPNVPGTYLGGHELGEGVAELIVLFYGIELAINTAWRRAADVRAVFMVILMLMLARSLLA